MQTRAVISMAPESAAAGDELYRRLQLSLLLRVIMVTFLLGATVVIHITRSAHFLTVPLIALYLLSGVTYSVALVSTIALRWVKRLSPFAFIQIFWEVIFVSALIWATGGIGSIFSFLYLLAIIVGGILRYRRGAFLAAATGALFYGLIVAGMEQGLIPPLLKEFYEPVGWQEIIYNFFINLAAMFMMAVFSSYLAEKLRTTGDELQETMRDREALEALNDDIVRSLSSGLITLDLNGKITSFNEASQIITDIQESLAVGNDFKNIFPRAADILHRSVPPHQSNSSRHEITWENPKGETRHLEFRISALREADKELLGTLVIFNDITELREMEERLRNADRLAAVGQLAAGIAHEVRNPLASISGAVQVLGDELEDEKSRDRLMRIVIRETDRLDSLINDFLLYARPTPRTIQKVSLDRLIPEMMESYKHRTDIPSGIEWKLRVTPGLEMETDPKLLEQILWNLVNNAVQAMPAGGKLAVLAHEEKLPESPDSTESTDPAVHFIKIVVEDKGPGIPPQYRDKIFDPFFTTREKGTGLGLSTVYRIVDAMEGTISAQDVKGGGARFVVKIPRCSPVPAGVELMAEDEHETQFSGGGQ